MILLQATFYNGKDKMRNEFAPTSNLAGRLQDVRRCVYWGEDNRFKAMLGTRTPYTILDTQKKEIPLY